MTALLRALVGNRFSMFEVLGFILATRFTLDGDLIGAVATVGVFTVCSVAIELYFRRSAA